MRKAILITGATSDLGYEYLKSLKSIEKKIIAFYFDFEERLYDLEKNYNLDIEKVKCDFLDIDNLSGLVKEISLKYSITEVLHLAAPPVVQERFHKVSLAQFQRDISIQLYSIIEILKVIIPNMKKGKYGKIIIVLSSCTIGVPPKFWTSYVTTKYALLGLIKSLIAEYAQFNIQINGISPSLMETKFLSDMDTRLVEMSKNENPLKRSVTLSEVVKSIQFLLSEDISFLSGNNIIMTGGEVF